MKFNLRESVPIFNDDTPVAAKIAALIFLISYVIALQSLFSLIHTAYLLFVRPLPASPQISGDSLRRLALFVAGVTGVWELIRGFLISKLLFRRRWAKNVLSGIALCMFLMIFWAHLMKPENASLNLSNNLENVAEVVAVALLFTRESRAWFRFRA